ncbi:MAG: hypothetical protein NZ930_01755 [Candidatus Bipolaricaulota bacterium]|nr:hypothetical protein [Candidatus Bipolaricaulota bacterium]MDW8030201.1 hypothetical protein [Candidatus Bipolaricaulota bacterium]
MSSLRLLVLVIGGVLAALFFFLLLKERHPLSQGRFAINPEVFFVWDDSKKLYKIEPNGLETLYQGPFTVYFPSPYQPQAEEVAHALAQILQVAQRRLSLDLGAFSVVLVLLREDMGGVFIESWPTKPVPQFLVSSMKWTKLSEAPRPTRLMVYAVFPHEAAHLVLMWEGHWLEEGIAEYIGFIVVQELAPDLCQTYREGRQKDVREILPRGTYDLTREPLQEFVVHEGIRLKTTSPEEGAGYGVSLAFWLQIAREHGETIIRQFVEQAKSLSQPTERELARILSNLTGEDIWGKLQRMNLQEVLQILEQAPCESSSLTAP